MKIDIKRDFGHDYVSREAGERLRNLIIEADKRGESVEIEFSNSMIASASFFDEGLAKLGAEGWGREKIKTVVQLKNLHALDGRVLEEMYRNREVR